MNWSVVGPAVFSLIGVVLGTSGSIIGQHLATRTSKAQAREDRYAALRAERKDAIREFLETMEQVERAAEDRAHQGERPEEVAALTHRMWFLQKCIDLVATPRLRRATDTYAYRLHRAIWADLPTDIDIWQYMADDRAAFMEAARNELDIPDLADSSQAASPEERTTSANP